MTVTNLVTPKAVAKHELLFNKLASDSLTSLLRIQSHFIVLLKLDLDVERTHIWNWGGFVEHLSLTLVAQQNVTKIISVTNKSLVTPKAGAKRELLFNEPTSGLLNKCSCLAWVLSMNKFYKNKRVDFGHTVVLLTSNLDVQRTHIRGKLVEHLSLT